MNLKDKIRNGLATLADQDEALKNPDSAYYFARFITGADIEKCQEVACRDPEWAYCFAMDVEGADIEKCQEAACRDPMEAFYFAISFREKSDIEGCQEAACKDPKEAYYFVHYVPGADIDMSLEACKGTKYEDMLNEYLMNKVLI